jgi:hypothetical protein
MIMSPHPIAQKSTLALALDTPGQANQSFFNPVQAHVAESVPPAWATTTTPSPNAKKSSCGTGHPAQPERTSKEGLSPQMVFPFVSTGKS